MASSTYLTRTPASNGSVTTATMSAWVKRSATGEANQIFGGQTGSDGNNRTKFGIESDDTMACQLYNSSSSYDWRSSRLLKDHGAWYHLVYVFDTTNGTPGDRIRFYCNGDRITNFGTQDTIPEDAELKMNTTSDSIFVGARKTSSTINQWFNGCMSHVHFIDGTAYEASTFGETDSTSGIWKIKTSPSVTYGTNGFFLKLEDSSNMDLDSGTNAFTNFTTSGNLTAIYDNPSNNFATFNPGENYYPAATYSNGNTTIVTPSSAVYAPSTSTFGMSGGKWYAEFKTSTTMYDNLYGITDRNATANGQELGDGANQWGYYQTTGSVRYNNGYASPSPYGSSFDNTEVLGIALDLDNSKLYFAIDGTWQNSGDPTSGATGTGALSITAVESTLNGQYFFAVGGWANAASTFHANFGNGYFATTAVSSANADDAGIGAFEYDVPAGYYALCTKNIKAYGG